MAPKRYTLLRTIGAFYKLLAGLCFLTTTGAVFYSAVNTFKDTPAGVNAGQTTLNMLGQALPVAVIGLVLMITFYAFSQLIELGLNIWATLRTLVHEHEAVEEFEAASPSQVSRAGRLAEESRQARR
jgi:hypothetical protein